MEVEVGIKYRTRSTPARDAAASQPRRRDDARAQALGQVVAELEEAVARVVSRGRLHRGAAVRPCQRMAAATQATRSPAAQPRRVRTMR
eukprot:scaffold3302_cov335-Prasinococcus_capsulatus_cf.AAC.6